VANRAWAAFRVVSLDGWRFLMIKREPHTKDTKNAMTKGENGMTKAETERGMQLAKAYPEPPVV
jgi:hypothetical protein